MTTYRAVIRKAGAEPSTPSIGGNLGEAATDLAFAVVEEHAWRAYWDGDYADFAALLETAWRITEATGPAVWHGPDHLAVTFAIEEESE